MRLLSLIQSELLDVTEKLEKIFAEAGDGDDYSKVTSLEGTPEEKAKAVDALLLKQTELLQEEKSVKSKNDARDLNKNIISNIKTTVSRSTNVDAGMRTDRPEGEFSFKNVIIPGSARRVKLRSFQNDERGDAYQKAFALGMYLLALKGSKKGLDFCDKHNIEKVALESDDSLGGFLVPEQFVPDLINLVEQYGVAAQIALNVPMMRDTISWPVKTAGLTAEPVGEGEGGTAQDNRFSRVGVTAKDWTVLGQVSMQLNEDTALAYADIFLREAARAIAYAQDNAFFNGTGTFVTYHSIVGCIPKLEAVAGGAAGIHQAATGHNTYPELDAADFTALIGKLPEFADTPNACFVVSKAFWGASMLKLLLAAGGNSKQDLISGTAKEFMGYPVYISQVMPKTAANDQLCCLLGDFTQGAILGNRSEFAVALSDSHGDSFAQGLLTYRVWSRWGITIHGVGNSTDASAITALKLASS